MEEEVHSEDIRQFEPILEQSVRSPKQKSRLTICFPLYSFASKLFNFSTLRRLRIQSYSSECLTQNPTFAFEPLSPERAWIRSQHRIIRFEGV